MKTFSVILIGAGMRGTSYTTIMKNHPDQFKVVAVAEPNEGRRRQIQELHNLSDDCCFYSWEDILSKPKMADIALICTMDNMHYEVALKAIALGYNLVLEKPVAQTAKQCADIALAAKRKGVKVLVCHVLRYTPFFNTVKKLVMDGTIGKIMSVIHVESVGVIHSYVRGNWHSEKETSPMLLAKCCHDIDILQWLIDKPCKKVQSFGDRTYFREENAPEGAPARCIDGGCPIEETCPYNCKKVYYYHHSQSQWLRPACAQGIAKEYNPTDDEILAALHTTDYGLCVFRANNDVVDHQIVNMEFEGGATASLTMNGFGRGGRYIRIFGTKGELYANMSDKEITFYTFSDAQFHNVKVSSLDEGIMSGHGGGDQGIISELYDYLSGNYAGYRAADIEISVKNHLIGFAAERSRHNNTVEDIAAFFKAFGMTNE